MCICILAKTTRHARRLVVGQGRPGMATHDYYKGGGVAEATPITGNHPQRGRGPNHVYCKRDGSFVNQKNDPSLQVEERGGGGYPSCTDTT